MRGHRERGLPAVQTAVIDAIQDERHAAESYRRVIASHGDAVPFDNVVYADRQHAASLTRHVPSREHGG